MADTLPAPYGDEMKGISQASGLPLGKLNEIKRLSSFENGLNGSFTKTFLRNSLCKFENKIFLQLDRKLYFTVFYCNLGEIVLYNIFYEVSSYCTSIVGQDQNGNIFHGRNLDFGGLLG